MRDFLLDAISTQSSVTLAGVKYILTKHKNPTSDVFVFTVDEPDKERDQVLLTKSELFALYLLMTSKSYKK